MVAENYDGGRAWAVAFAACVINFILAGMGRVSGIFFVALMQQFGADRRQTSVVFTLRSATRNLLGPVVGILGQKYGPQAVVAVGGMINAIGITACYYANSLTWITVLWGAVSGVGCALSGTLGQVVIGQYFRKYRTTAAGLGFSGGCVGSFIFPVFVEYSIWQYGLNGTYLLLGGITLNSVAAALILKKPPWLKHPPAKKPDCNTEANIGQINLAFDNNEGKDIDTSNINTNSIYKQSNKEERKTIVEYPDIQFLRNNIVLLTKTLKHKFSNESSNKENDGRKSFSGDDSFEMLILDFIDDMHYFIQKESGRLHLFDKTSAGLNAKPFGVQNIGSALTSYHNSLSFRIKDDNISGVLEKNKAKSVTNISKINTKMANYYIMMKIQKLIRQNRTDILTVFSDENPECVLCLLDEIEKLHVLYNKKFSIANSYEENNKSLPSILNLNSAKENHNASKEVVCVPTFVPKSDLNDATDKDGTRNAFLNHIITAVKLYRNPLFLMICACRSVHFLTFVPVMTTVVDFIMDKGLPQEDGKNAIAAISFGDLTGRLCLGWITDKGYLTVTRYIQVVMLIQGATTALLPFMRSKLTLFLTFAIFAAFQGSLFARHPVLVNKYMRPNEQSIAMGCINFFSGFIGLILPMYIGYFRDTIGSYDKMFFINSAIAITIGLLWNFEPYYLKIDSRIRAKSNEMHA